MSIVMLCAPFGQKGSHINKLSVSKIEISYEEM